MDTMPGSKDMNLKNPPLTKTVCGSQEQVGVADTGRKESNVNTEGSLLGNENQYTVHGADGPFLMHKSRWPKLSLQEEHDSQS